MGTPHELSADQLRLLVRLDDGKPLEESLGVRVSALSETDAAIAQELRQIGLAEIVGGWNGLFWLRLTQRGRKVRLSEREG